MLFTLFKSDLSSIDDNLSSIDFAIKRFFMKLLRTNIRIYESYFNFAFPSTTWAKCVTKFDKKFMSSGNGFCNLTLFKPITVMYSRNVLYLCIFVFGIVSLSSMMFLLYIYSFLFTIKVALARKEIIMYIILMCVCVCMCL